MFTSVEKCDGSADGADCDADEFRFLHDAVSRHDEAAGCGDEDARSSLVVVLLSLLAKARDIAAVVSAPALSRLQVAHATAFVDAHLDEQISAHDVAAELHMNTKRFSRAFRHAMGLPVYQFILRRRTELALTLLRETGLPLAEIALRAGFSHQAHMTRMPSRLRGETPLQIRAQARRPT